MIWKTPARWIAGLARPTLLATGLFLFIAACTQPAPTPTVAPTATTALAPTAPTAPTATTAAIMGLADPAQAALKDAEAALLLILGEQNASGQNGWAAFTAKAGKTMVILSLPPAATDSELVHIHSGSCGPTLGGVVYPLTKIAGGTSVTTVDVPLVALRTGGFAINAHKKGEPGVNTACGNIPVEADARTIALGEQNASGQAGWATLTARGGSTEVVLALLPGKVESELVHIHSGQCGPALGGVVHPLTKIAEGASASTVKVTLASVSTGGFAVNAHKKGEPGVNTACGNIPKATTTAGGSTGQTATGQSTPTGDASNY